ncbi:metallophosphoesterase family protein [Caulobacter sp. LARHSG274]
MFSRKSLPQPQVPDDQVIYAVGDIHGRLDLLERLIKALKADLAATNKPGVFIPLGDYVDRGPNSAGVVQALIDLQSETWIRSFPLRGNHEQMALDFLNDPERNKGWLSLGGAATLASYNVLRDRTQKVGDWAALREAMAQAVPEAHLKFLQSLPYCAVAGDYFFVHAGVRPGRGLDEQTPEDMLWIREKFLREKRLGLDKVIVHGHSTSMKPFVSDSRIGVDTGAYATGVLTCLRLTGGQRSLIRVSLNGAEVQEIPDLNAR